MKKRYYMNDDGNLIIATFADDGWEIVELDPIAESHDEEEADVQEKKTVPRAGKDGKSIRFNWRTRDRVKELLDIEMNSAEIARSIGKSLEITNMIIDKVRGEDMESKVKDTKDGVSL